MYRVVYWTGVMLLVAWSAFSVYSAINGMCASSCVDRGRREQLAGPPAQQVADEAGPLLPGSCCCSEPVDQVEIRPQARSRIDFEVDWIRDHRPVHGAERGDRTRHVKRR